MTTQSSHQSAPLITGMAIGAIFPLLTFSFFVKKMITILLITRIMISKDMVSRGSVLRFCERVLSIRFEQIKGQ